MTDLLDPEIRGAGARALMHYARDAGITWLEKWDLIATELGPVIAMTAVREQMRGGIDDAGTEHPQGAIRAWSYHHPTPGSSLRRWSG